MTHMKIFLAYLILATAGFAAETRFGGNIIFRGQQEGQMLRCKNFNIAAKEKNFELTCKSTNLTFEINPESRILQDAVVSKNGKSIAVSLKVSNDSRNLQECLATVTDEKLTRVAYYTDRMLVEDLGWIVELGAVSDDGSVILAKCAKFLPSSADGVSRVNHVWAFLKIQDSKIMLIQEVNIAEAIKWP